MPKDRRAENLAELQDEAFLVHWTLKYYDVQDDAEARALFCKIENEIEKSKRPKLLRAWDLVMLDGLKVPKTKKDAMEFVRRVRHRLMSVFEGY